MIRTVVLPFGRGGIIGGTMLALGRALGETIAVLLIISPAFEIKFRMLEVGTMTISALIAGRFGEATPASCPRCSPRASCCSSSRSASTPSPPIFVNRSRSGAATEI